MAEPTREAVEKAARELHRQMFAGCVTWHDTTDTATTGSDADRRRALEFAEAALVASGLAAEVERLRETVASMNANCVPRTDWAFQMRKAEAYEAVLNEAREALAAINRRGMRGEAMRRLRAALAAEQGGD